MKTQNYIYNIGLAVLVALVSMVACKKKDDSSTAQTPTYQYVNGQCVNTLNQQVMPAQYCQQTNTNNGYYMLNGQCYSPQGQVVAYQYCQQSNNGYYVTNGQCYSPQGQPVAYQYCQQTNGGYYMQNGYCYSPQGQIVSNQLCAQNGGISGQACYGTYLYQSGYWTNMIYCNGANCRGYTLVEVSTNRTVTCQ